MSAARHTQTRFVKRIGAGSVPCETAAIRVARLRRRAVITSRWVSNDGRGCVVFTTLLPGTAGSLTLKIVM